MKKQGKRHWARAMDKTTPLRSLRHPIGAGTDVSAGLVLAASTGAGEVEER
jgi:hypothetical protein